ncbi:RagB/SusD family nutrient uptake outer membrane protein [Niabella pedocola]|uniref:RagB/SusD family nutrient uptake outer membrane protein n=1 Tax=Niabella pedocola TaxID=1752077 RepID=A0ABS8PQS5_9BACT|nr:RagB/SusD family nutrient uptake outer membrane protein [Niabella pedocola]MCD2422633.1 RagB/SusD family nutrient uptake outer membrane protein [Niabella pedocola]
MKRISYILLATTLLGVSCKKEFLQRNPQTNVTKEEFFNTPADLETYTNGLYTQLRATWADVFIGDKFSDDISVFTGGSEVDNFIRGGITPATVGGWNTWNQLRSINYMLDNAGKTTGDQAAINHYIGIARFFRANFYYKMVKRYGDVPWYGHVMGTKDEDMLYKAKDPRTMVVDSIMADLEYAAANVLPARTNNTYVTKWGALTLLARIALHEGTYRKYHTELNLQASAQTYLQRAISASQEIISNGGFDITGSGAAGYRALFSSADLSANKEVIFLQKSSKDLGVTNNTGVVLDWQWALNGRLADEFLMNDGTPFTSVPGYDKKTFTEIFANRDPRLAETIMPPGFTTTPTNSPYVTRPSFGGYLQVKFYPRDPALRGGYDLNYTDLPIFRYAEVLLINAEAKAESGTLAQTDLNATVNKLRSRVGMPALDMAAANAAPDAYLAAAYPLVTGSNKGVILEIRRERRVELACEGFRLDDLYRWKSGALLAQKPVGIYVPALGALDVTGDGVADIAILQSKTDESPIAGLPASVKDKLTKYYISDGDFILSNGTSGQIMFTKDNTSPRSFIEPKYYYFPIPLEQTVLNKNLTQPTGWQ